MNLLPAASRRFAGTVLAICSLALVGSGSLGSLGSLGLLGPTGARAEPPTTIRFTLDGRLEAPAAAFVLAVDREYFRAEGLVVSIDPGLSSREAISRVASGAYDMGFADVNALARFRDENPSTDVKAIMIVYDRSPSAIVGRKSRGISTDLASLKGKRFGAPVGDTAHAQWPILKAVNKIDDASMVFEKVGLPVRDLMLASGEVDAVFDASMASLPNLKSRGVAADDIVLLLMSDYGLELYGNAVIVSSKFAAEKPEAVKGFLRGFLKGLKDTVAEPEAAIDSVTKRNDGTGKDIELERLRMLIEQSIVTPWVKANGHGGIDRARFARAIDQMALAVSFRKKPAPEDIFTDAYLPADGDRKAM
jgi:NitT/TauT family transport system substrate-binding protein